MAETPDTVAHRLAVKARTEALNEATEALQSLADIALRSAAEMVLAGDHEQVGKVGLYYKTKDRHYFYSRAAQIVASIPKDRI